MSAPRVAVGPGPEPWAAEAIQRGGGEVVALDEDPVGLVWTDAGPGPTATRGPVPGALTGPR